MTVADLVEMLQRLPLLEDTQRSHLAALQQQFPDPQALTHELVRRSWLTAFQVEQLANGKGEQLVLDQYVLREVIGQGGMGTVFKARQRRVKRDVALKVLNNQAMRQAGAIDRFRREAQIAARLAHPNVVTLHDFNEVAGMPFLVMELLDGSTLAKLIDQQGWLPVADACDFIRQAALGLQHAHEQGLVHRDIKPANLMLTRQGLVKVMDLGLSRTVLAAKESASNAKLTEPGTMMGTADYLAPEQIRDAHGVDIRADIYSLGCTLYHLLAGKTPFPGGTLENKLAGHLFGEPKALDELRPEVPASVCSILRKMMAKLPEQRYQTPAEVAQALLPRSPINPLPTPESFSVPLEPPSRTPGEISDGHQQPALRTLTDPGTNTRTQRPARRFLLVAVLLLLTALSVLGGFLVRLFLLPPTDRTGVTLLTSDTSNPPTFAEEEPGHAPADTHLEPLFRLSPPLPTMPLPTLPPPVPPTRTLDLGNGVQLELVRIARGSFDMGAVPNDLDAEMNEKPQHRVTISRDFYLGQYAVTYGQFAQFVKATKYITQAEKNDGGQGYDALNHQIERRNRKYNWQNTGFLQTTEHPVVNVSWHDAQAFCNWLSTKTGRRITLPTEAEWEFAARAGTPTRFFTGNAPASLQGFANVADQTLKAEGIKKTDGLPYFPFRDGYAFTAPVGKFKANPWQLYDMTGNVWQWCADAERDYDAQPKVDPRGDDDNSRRVVRGGSWTDVPKECRCSFRYWTDASDRNCSAGFRVVERPD